MPLLDAVILFFGSFFSVGLLGIQSKNVNQSKYVAAVVTSLFISISQVIFIRYMAVGGLIPFSVAALGGCLGIAFSIWLYDNVLKKRVFKKPNNVEEVSVTIKLDSAEFEKQLAVLETRARALGIKNVTTD